MRTQVINDICLGYFPGGGSLESELPSKLFRVKQNRYGLSDPHSDACGQDIYFIAPNRLEDLLAVFGVRDER